MDVNVQCSKTPLEHAQTALKQAKSLLVLTGAGISVGSGIPTYRGMQAASEEEIQRGSREAFVMDPEGSWDYYREVRKRLAACAPNPAHLALAAWGDNQRRGLTVVTQNVDGLHRRAKQRGLVELHGSIELNRCLGCDHIHEDEKNGPGTWPRCPMCKDYERPHVVWMGEEVTRPNNNRVEHAFRKCDLLVSIGTSGQVAHTAYLLLRAQLEGLSTIHINPERPAFEGLWIAGDAAKIVPALLA